MQEKPIRRTNRARTDATRAALVAAARSLFVENGYADTGTPAIVAGAQVTRGALYHHFADKADLFRAVLMQEAEDVANEINRQSAGSADPVEALLSGARAYFDAMAVPGRSRLLLLDGPAVLGHRAMIEIDKATGGATLRDGLDAALSTETRNALPLEPLAELLSAAFDRAALAISDGQAAADYHAAIRALLSGLLASEDGDRSS